MTNINFKSVVIIGLGLIGSSLARAIREKEVSNTIYGIDINEENIKKCLNLKIISKGEKNLEDLKEQADLKQQQSDERTAELDELKKSLMDKQQLELQSAQEKYAKLLEIANKYGQDTTLLTEQYELQVKEIQDRYDEQEKAAQQKIEDEKAAIRQQAGQQALDAGRQIFGALNDIAQQKLESEKSSLQKQLDAGTISQEKFDKETAKIEEKALKRRKRKAMLDILISTAQGVAGAIKGAMAVPFPFNLAAIATGVAAVMAGIASAKAVLSEVPGDGGGGGDVSAGGGAGGGDEGPGGMGPLTPNIEGIQASALGGGGGGSCA